MTDNDGSARLPEPLAQPESDFFWEQAKKGALWLKHCDDCDRCFFYPRALCPRCFSRQTRWIPSKGEGVLYSFAIVHRAPAPAFADRAPYVIALVDLDEGARMPTSLIDVACDPKAIRIGMEVEAVYDAVTDETTLIRFRPRSLDTSS